MGLNLHGLTDALHAVKLLGEGVREIVAGEIGEGSMDPYAFGIETGQHRRGRLARRAGGAWYMRSGMEKLRPEIPKAIGGALAGGITAVRQTKRTLAERLVALTRPFVPVRSGHLRDSLMPIYPGGPSPAQFTQQNSRGYRGATRTTRSVFGRNRGGRLR